jgi:hypothetical protein
MFPFSGTKPIDNHESLVGRLLDAGSDERQFVLMTALQSGELRLSEATEVLRLVSRIESFCRPVPALATVMAASHPTA